VTEGSETYKRYLEATAKRTRKNVGEWEEILLGKGIARKRRHRMEMGPIRGVLHIRGEINSTQASRVQQKKGERDPRKRGDNNDQVSK